MLASNAEPAANKCGQCKAKRLTKTEEKKEETEKTMIDKRILRVLEVGDGPGEKIDIGIENDMDVDLADEGEKEKLKTLISAAKTLGPSLLQTTKTAKEVIAEKMRLLKQHEERSNNLETKTENAIAARVKQAEEKAKAKQREEERHAAAMALLGEEFAQAELHQTKTMEDAAADLKRINEQYQKDILKLDEYMEANSIVSEAPAQAPAEKEKDEDNRLGKDAIMKHLVMDTNLAGKEMTPELIAESFMRMMESVRQAKRQKVEHRRPAPALPAQHDGSQAEGTQQ